MFSQAANVDRLLSMLRNLDPAQDNLADNEEIQELYRSCMTLRPKIVKLIDKYSQKRGMLSLCIKCVLTDLMAMFLTLQLTWCQ